MGPIEPTQRSFNSIASVLDVNESGTMQWELEDDQEMRHKIQILNSLFVLESPTRILPPQHWSQEASDHYPTQRGIWCATIHNG